MAQQLTIEQMAYEASTTGNVVPLQEIGKQLQEQTPTDQYFWAYLSLNPEVFFRIYKEESERRQGILSPTCSCLEEPLPLGEVPPTNVSLSPAYRVTEYIRSIGYDYFISANNTNALLYLRQLLSNTYRQKLINKYIEKTIEKIRDKHRDPTRAEKVIEYSNSIKRLKLYQDTNYDLSPLIEKITQLPNVAICGGLPSRCVYQKWNSNPTLNEKEIVLEVRINGRRACIVPDEFDVDIFILSKDDEEVKTAVRGIMTLINGYTMKIIEGIIGNFHQHGIDPALQDLYINQLKADNIWFESEGAIWVKVGIVNFQIIKRMYSNLNEIFLGFDLDSSAVALTRDGFITSERFRSAVHYGQNVIIPMRQSKSYMYRLHKYAQRGFTIMVPGSLNTNLKHQCLIELMKTILHLPEKKFFMVSDYIDSSDKEELLASLRDFLLYPNVNYFLNNSMIFDSDRMDMSKWRRREPGSQITSTFNPTNYDFLGCQNIQRLEEKRLIKIADEKCVEIDEERHQEREEEYQQRGFYQPPSPPRTIGKSKRKEEESEEENMEESMGEEEEVQPRNRPKRFTTKRWKRVRGEEEEEETRFLKHKKMEEGYFY